MRPLLGSLVAASALLLTGAAQADDSEAIYRVFVGDHQKASITALDLAAPEKRWIFETKGQVKLYSIARGAAVAAVQSDSDHVHLLTSGVRLSDHGDHADLATEPPRLLGEPVTGPRPFHVVSHDGQTAINFDNGGYALIYEEKDLAEGRLVFRKFAQAVAHHGFVAPFGSTIMSTVASAPAAGSTEAPLRQGLQAFYDSGAAAGPLAPCTAIHGEAYSGAFLAAGCKEGVLTVTEKAGAPIYRLIPYPADFPNTTTGTLLGGTSMQIFLGNHGADGLVVIDPAEEPHMRRIALPFRRVDFALDPQRPDTGFALTEDGSLHKIDLLAAKIVASQKVTSAYSMDGHWNDPRPRLAIAGDEVVMTDPRASLLRRLSVETLRETGVIKLDGAPYNIAVVGGSGVRH
jgi:hypothetical protein